MNPWNRCRKTSKACSKICSFSTSWTDYIIVNVGNNFYKVTPNKNSLILLVINTEAKFKILFLSATFTDRKPYMTVNSWEQNFYFWSAYCFVWDDHSFLYFFYKSLCLHPLSYNSNQMISVSRAPLPPKNVCTTQIAICLSCSHSLSLTLVLLLCFSEYFKRVVAEILCSSCPGGLSLL